ncbi:MAG: helix-turn-helix transcriptional regulator [Rhodospirillales bacterium]|nr:helix-turn-helix transcriptional regulator [Rhodospirillales bacterium]
MARRATKAEEPSSFFGENLSHLYRVNGFSSQSALGSALGIERSVLSKLMNGTRAPTSPQRVRIAQYFKVQQSDLDLPPRAFAEGVVQRSGLVFLALRSVRQNMRRCQEVAERYQGQYVVYYPQADAGTIIASLLSVGRVTHEGIDVSLLNPHRDSNDKVTAYKYTGYMYPVREFFYFYFEQPEAEYEILSLIIHESRTPQVSVLKGMLSGVGILEESSFIAARPVVAVRRQREIADWEKALGTELGYVPSGRVPEMVRRQLSTERISVRV